MMTAMSDFFSMIWQGLQGLILPPFNISAASFLLGIFVVDVSIAIFGTLIHFYSGASHAIGRLGSVHSRNRNYRETVNYHNRSYLENVRYHNAMIRKRH